MSACHAGNPATCADPPCRDAGPEADGDGAEARAEDHGDGSDEIEPPPDDAGVEADTSTCPPEKVFVPPVGVCTDRYEASRRAGDLPVSVAGAMPWNRIAWGDAQLACTRAGKRLCLPDEWEAACRGPRNHDYPYGPEPREGYCNISYIDPDAGLRSLCPTATFDRCVGGYPGLFDMIGNVAEWTDERQFQEDAGGGNSSGHTVSRSPLAIGRTSAPRALGGRPDSTSRTSGSGAAGRRDGRWAFRRTPRNDQCVPARASARRAVATDGEPDRTRTDLPAAGELRYKGA